MSTRTLLEQARHLRISPSTAEEQLWRLLNDDPLRGYEFQRRVWIGGFVGDFVCTAARLVIEIDGGQFSGSIDYEALRVAYLQKRGFRVIRFWRHEILCHPEEVLERLCSELACGTKELGVGS